MGIITRYNEWRINKIEDEHNRRTALAKGILDDMPRYVRGTTVELITQDRIAGFDTVAYGSIARYLKKGAPGRRIDRGVATDRLNEACAFLVGLSTEEGRVDLLPHVIGVNGDAWAGVGIKPGDDEATVRDFYEGVTAAYRPRA